MTRAQADEQNASRVVIAPELPGIVLTVAIVVSACAAIGRTGMPEIAVPFAAPTFVTAMIALTDAWVRDSRIGR